MKKLSILVLLLFFSSVFADDKIEFLGNPYKHIYKHDKNIYSRNIWDMHYYKGKIFLGAGNSSNKGPSSNSGRTAVVYLDTKNDNFYRHYTVAEEQIDLYKTINDTLYIPGHDATQKWDFGNFYKLHKNRWKKYRTIPKALHVYDMVQFKGKLFTALGMYGSAAVGISKNKGKKWKIQKLNKGRVYTFLQFKNQLYAVKYFKDKKTDQLALTKYNKKLNIFLPVDNMDQSKVFPNTKLKKRYKKITRVKSIGDRLLYLGSYTHNDHQSIPFAAYMAQEKLGKLKIKKITLEKNSTPRDILVRGKSFYILVSKKQENKSIISVLKYQTDKLDHYEKIIEFKSETFARSFEESDGTFYFALGSEIKDQKRWSKKELLIQTGDIIKIEKVVK